ncbi:arginine/serine-rich splicing factor 35 [Actinidia rufa]|uniref:Arginine/serine-rich splicing factor 35 n=1 Tax=Actinidia rufa TaxID=165716 RepID=A0A7J0E692_9ERIC|nr:arginine/serine-rich splicing factor 35 [Actinidia rufa]
MEDERDAEDAIRGLDRFEFGRKGRRLRVEWTKQERGVRRPGNSRRSSTNSRPSKTLFVINFDPYHTRTRDLERHFDPYGKILNVRIRRNFAFIQYESEEDASRALDATNMRTMMKGEMDTALIGVVIGHRDGEAMKGDDPRVLIVEREGSPDYGRGRSPSPYRRERASPDYGRGPSLSPYKKERSNSDYDRRHSQSRRERPSPDHGHERSPRERVTPDYGSGRSPSTKRERTSPDDYRRGPSPQRERISPDDYRRSSTPQREGISPDDYRRGPSPDSKPEPKDSPNYNGAESPMEDGYRSRSPLERERSRSRSRS